MVWAWGLEPQRITAREPKGTVTLNQKPKVTEFYFNEHDDFAEIYTHNTDLKKRPLAYAKEYPKLCQLTKDDEQGGLRFEIDKHRIGIRLTVPYARSGVKQ